MNVSFTRFALLLGASVSPLAAQSADNFHPDDLTEKIVADASGAEASASRVELMAKPSRNVGIDVDAYIQTLASSFSMRGRDFDPFGRHQDPNFEPPKPIAPTRTTPTFKPQITPFSDIVAGIRVTAVIPAQQRFLVDERSFQVGDRINLSTAPGKILPVHVVSINAATITFRNGETNETADISLQMMPPGMSRGSEEARPPGVVPAGSDAPLSIEPVNSLSTSR